MSLVEREATPLTEYALGQALQTGYHALFGYAPGRRPLTVAWAQLCLENAHGSALYCYNFGNITAYAWEGDHYEFATEERVKRNPDVWQHVKLAYRAYQSPEVGAAGYWKLIFDRYQTAFKYFEAGEPTEAANALGDAGYYTAHKEKYAETMTKVYAELLAKYPMPELTEYTLTDEDRRAIEDIDERSLRDLCLDAGKVILDTKDDEGPAYDN